MNLAAARPPPGCEHGERRKRHRQVIEDRALAASTSRHSKRKDIGDAGNRSGGRRRDPAPNPGDDERRGRCENPGDQLILNDPDAAEQPDRSIDKKEAHRLAVPDVHKRKCPTKHSVAHEQVELLINIDKRVPNIM